MEPAEQYLDSALKLIAATAMEAGRTHAEAAMQIFVYGLAGVVTAGSTRDEILEIVGKMFALHAEDQS